MYQRDEAARLCAGRSKYEQLFSLVFAAYTMEQGILHQLPARPIYLFRLPHGDFQDYT